MDKPYFDVGEEVIVNSGRVKEINGDAVVIEILPPFTGNIVNPRNSGRNMFNDGGGFSYWLTVSHTEKERWSGWVGQSSLRKKHKPSGKSFQEIMTNLQPTEKTL
ncbi:MAG: hypothetical protein V3U97_02695 [bacterium]